MPPLYPAIFLGGPPHSGKTTLSRRLSEALRQRSIQHYVLHATPDGEGDWADEVQTGLVAELRGRAKTGWTPRFAALISRDIAGRHLPLLVDAGGRVTEETARVAAVCTHAILIAANSAELASWNAMVTAHGLSLIAEVRSSLHGTAGLEDIGAVLRGTIVGLAPHLDSSGPCFAALLDRVAQICGYDAEQLFRAHARSIDADLIIRIDRPIHPLPAHSSGQPWQPHELATLLASLPVGLELAVYGRGPVWIYAALAAHASPAPCPIFDVRLGWVTPPSLILRDDPGDPTALICDREDRTDRFTHLRFTLALGYLDLHEPHALIAPIVPTDRGIILDGKLPNWLFAALTRAYIAAPWIAVYEPRLQSAIVVLSRRADHAVGTVYSLGRALS